MFGFGKKQKASFKIPVEVLALRARIEDENRENYPHLVRYQELVKSVKVVFAQLDAIIAQGEYAEEAVRIKEDIKKKIGQLSDKINSNRKEVGKEGNRGYVASNMAYLERKGMRNQAKTLFTECLDAIESIMKCCKEERLKNETAMKSGKDVLIRAMSALHYNYFQEHGQDKEINDMRDELLERIEDLNNYFEENNDRLKEHGLEENVQSVRIDIARATRRLAE
jgi:hypothetical protein